jgi:curli biogenesis system outer membrane secretion channel CsgG
MREIRFAIAICLSIGSNLCSQDVKGEATNIAVLDLSCRNISLAEAQVISDKLRIELQESGEFAVIEREAMENILAEQGFQQTGCTSSECAVEAGRIIGVTRMVAGTIGRIENTFLLTLRLIDVETGQVIKNVDEEVTGTLTDVLKASPPFPS